MMADRLRMVYMHILAVPIEISWFAAEYTNDFVLLQSGTNKV